MTQKTQRQKEIERLRHAISRGEKSVRFGDRTIEYRSVDELMKALALLEGEEQRERGRSRVVRIYHGGKGL